MAAPQQVAAKTPSVLEDPSAAGVARLYAGALLDAAAGGLQHPTRRGIRHRPAVELDQRSERGEIVRHTVVHLRAVSAASHRRYRAGNRNSSSTSRWYAVEASKSTPSGNTCRGSSLSSSASGMAAMLTLTTPHLDNPMSVVIGNVRVQALSPSLVRIELTGPNGFEERGQLKVEGQTENQVERERDSQARGE